MSVQRAANIKAKLSRALSLIADLDRHSRAFTDTKPYTVRVKREIDHGKPVGRLIAIRNPKAGNPDVILSILAGEVLYQLRSCLDHAVNDLIIRNGKKKCISTKTAFPIFIVPSLYSREGPTKINGVTKRVAKIIEGEQPYKRQPDSPKNDPLWILHELNNTDKHRFVSATVFGLNGVVLSDSKGQIGTLTSRDVVLKHRKVFFSFTLEIDRYDEIQAQLHLAVAFKDAMAIHGITMSIQNILWSCVYRVMEVLSRLGFATP